MKNINTLCMFTFICPFISAIIIFSKAHGMSILSHTKVEIRINICHIKFFQCVRFKPRSSSSTNVENSTSNFRQSVQICCREAQKEENNGNCQAFCVTRKRNKSERHQEKFVRKKKIMKLHEDSIKSDFSLSITEYREDTIEEASVDCN